MRCHFCKRPVEVEREALSNACAYCSGQQNAAAKSNYDTALKAEAKKVVRCWTAFTPEQRASNAANHRMHHQQRRSFGEFYYVHPGVPGVAFPKRFDAARAALAKAA